MTRRLGPIMQVAYVIADLDEAIAHWTRRLGVGPFFVRREISYPLATYRGEPSHPVLSLAFAYSGELNIELMQQHNTDPSVFREHVNAHGYGLQHVGVLSDNLEADTAYLSSQGIGLLQRLVNPSGIETRFYDTEHHPGAMLELIQRSPAVEASFARMKAAARAWDGIAPIAE